MEWGEQEQFLEDVVSKTIGKTPQALLDKPLLFDDLEPALAAFCTLSRSRVNAEFPQSIMISEIACYHKVFDLSYPVSEFVRYIQAADDAYMKHVANKHGKK